MVMAFEIMSMRGLPRWTPVIVIQQDRASGFPFFPAQMNDIQAAWSTSRSISPMDPRLPEDILTPAARRISHIRGWG